MESAYYLWYQFRGGGQLVNEYKKVIEKFRDLEYYSRDLPVSACELIAEGSPFTYRTFTILALKNSSIS